MNKCCIFKDRPTEAEVHRRLERVESIDFSDRHRHTVYRCRECGAYVLYEYEEVSCFMPGENWDDADIYHRYYPVDGIEHARRLVDESPFRVSGEDEIQFYDHYCG